MYILNMEWERLERLFSLCAAIVLAEFPQNSKSSVSFSDVTLTSFSPRTNVPFPSVSSVMIKSE